MSLFQKIKTNSIIVVETTEQWTVKRLWRFLMGGTREGGKRRIKRLFDLWKYSLKEVQRFWFRRSENRYNVTCLRR